MTVPIILIQFSLFSLQLLGHIYVFPILTSLTVMLGGSTSLVDLAFDAPPAYTPSQSHDDEMLHLGRLHVFML